MYKNLEFKSAIVGHLGKNLITASEVAFIELIKNSLDAEEGMIDKKVNVSYFSSTKEICPDFLLNKLDERVTDFIPKKYRDKDLFLIEDIGCGMCEEELDKGFLAIGTDVKKHRKKTDEIILGEKGIGRLAAQRLGKALLVETTSLKDKKCSLLLIDWDDVVDSKSLMDVRIPYLQFDSDSNSFTRMWILGVNELDMVKHSGWGTFFTDYSKLELNEELDNAVSFLVSPFNEEKTIEIRFFYDGHEIKYGFNRDLFKYAEAFHKFEIEMNKKGELELSLDMDVKPWYVKSVHKSCIKPSSEFAVYEKTNDEYVEFYNKYKKRIENTFRRVVHENDLCSFLVNDEKKKIKTSDSDDTERLNDFLRNEIHKRVKKINNILPIKGEVYTYKKDRVSCGTALEFMGEEPSGEAVKRIQLFLEDFNGIKLYRGPYRIGFLGNKDSDWLKLQQYKSVGHQFFRLNSGSSLGQVVVNDNEQKYIKEISSRLDIDHDELSITFLQIMEIVFNYFFFNDNETLNMLVKEWLADEGWTQGNIKKKIDLERRLTGELLNENRKLIQKLNYTKEILQGLETNEDGTRLFDLDSYDEAIGTLDITSAHIKKTNEYIKNSERELDEASAGLSKIEVEMFNNYKLMANGLITETITHELHSLVSTVNKNDKERELNQLGDFLWKTDRGIYDTCYIPIKDSYMGTVSSLEDVASLYKFLENTFIKQNSSDEYEVVSISQIVDKIRNKLYSNGKKNKIEIIDKSNNMSWYLPKGVLLHVLYNLITNSIYWIDQRRKRARHDSNFVINDYDSVSVLSMGQDCIRIYDTGTGVSPEMEEILFQALRSGKGPEGRGMGLYIVKQLLNSFSGEIELLPERNKFGNRYIFEITVPEECVVRVGEK